MMQALYISVAGIAASLFFIAVYYIKRSLSTQMKAHYDEKVRETIDDLERQARHHAQQHRNQINNLRVACGGDNNKCFVLGAVEINREYQAKINAIQSKINSIHRRK